MSASTDPAVRSRLSRRAAGVVVLVWLAGLAALGAVAPALEDVQADGGDHPPADSMSMRAAALARAELGATDAPPAVVVVRSSSPAEARRATARVVAGIPDAGLPALGAVRPGPVGEAGLTRTVLVSLEAGAEREEVRATLQGLRDVAAAAERAGSGQPEVETAVTGPAAIVVDAVEVFSGSDRVLLLGTLVLVVLLLFAIYRSPVLVVISLVGVGTAMRLAEGVGALLARAGVIEVSGQTASIMTVLLFGVGTDYALIIFARLREALAPHPDPRDAVVVAMRAVAGALLASVSTIVAAVLALLAAVTPTLRDFGPYLAVGVASMAVVAFTLVPALLLLAGRSAFWPRRPGDGGRPGAEGTAPRTARLWGRVADLVIAAPRRVLALGLAGLVLMSAGLAGAQQSFDLVSGFRIDTESARGQQLLADALGPGAIAPTQVLARAGSPLGPEQTGAVVQALAAAPGVARVGEPRSSEDGRTVAVDVVLEANPYSPEAMDRVVDLEAAAGGALDRAGVDEAEVLVGGETSAAADTRAALDRDLVVVGLLTLLVVSVVLGLVLRSLLAPLYLAVTLVLSYAATMGATVLLALTVGGDLGLGNRVAVYVLVFLVALGVDYTILMMTRYRQELARQAPVDALRTSVVRTGGVISAAGLILAGTFAVLMTQPIRELFQFGLAMAVGILLDTFVVRPLLVPAVIRLLGEHALWPSRPSRSGRPGRPSPDPSRVHDLRRRTIRMSRLPAPVTTLLHRAAATWTGVGLASGLYYRELTKVHDVPGGTQLAVVHTHALALGTLTMLVLLALAVALPRAERRLRPAFWVWQAGLATTAGALLVKGTLQVLDHAAADSPALAGVAGLGHLTLTVAFVLVFRALGAAVTVTNETTRTDPAGSTVTSGEAGVGQGGSMTSGTVGSR